MNLKNKISLIVSLLFTVIFAISSVVIYLLFADFRKEEFEIRLKNKALSSIKLLINVKQIDRQLLKIIDQNSIQKIYDEKTLIFDENFNLIYSSLDDTKITWSVNDLNYLKENNSFFRIDKDKETFGIFHRIQNKNYYALISASDKFGKRKLEYLLYILVFTYVIFTTISWFTTSYLIKRLLFPLDIFHNKLKGINENNLDTRIVVKDKRDEIDLLADEFNQMLARIDESYQKQKEFTSHASHELRTPIARITAQIENKIIAEQDDSHLKHFFRNLLVDINQLSELISSLLLLSKIDNDEYIQLESCRLDELIFEATGKINKTYPDFKLGLDIIENDVHEDFLEIKGSKPLLLIAFSNLLKNAYLYSDNKQADVSISFSEKKLMITISNNGKLLSENEQNILFQPFMRGKNAINKSGLGLGLRIVRRILIQQNATINYQISEDHKNTFNITFPVF